MKINVYSIEGHIALYPSNIDFNNELDNEYIGTLDVEETNEPMTIGKNLATPEIGDVVYVNYNEKGNDKRYKVVTELYYD